MVRFHSLYLPFFLSFTSLGDTQFSWEWAKSYGLTIAGLDEAKAKALCKWKLAVLLLTEARFIAKLVEAGFEEPVATEAWDKIPKKRTYSLCSVACPLLTPFRSRVWPSFGATQWCVSPVCCAPSSVYPMCPRTCCVLTHCSAYGRHCSTQSTESPIPTAKITTRAGQGSFVLLLKHWH